MTTTPQELFSVEGKTFLVTGASGALGSEAVRTLTAGGANVVLSGGNLEALERLAKDAPEGRVAVVNRRPDSVEDTRAMVETAVTTFGGLTGVVVASGVNKVAPIVDMPVEDFESVMDANVKGSWLVCREVGRQLLEQGDGGSIVLVSSTRGKLGHPAGYSAYCPSKAAVNLLAKSLAAEWGAAGIRVNALAPTVFRSDLTAWMYANDEKGTATREAMLSRIPLGRLAEPDDFAGALVYLLSAASAFLTGQVLYLDGGYTSC